MKMNKEMKWSGLAERVGELSTIIEKGDFNLMDLIIDINLAEKALRDFKKTLSQAHSQIGRTDKDAAEISFAKLCLNHKDVVKAGMLMTTTRSNKVVRKFLEENYEALITPDSVAAIKNVYALEFSRASKAARWKIITGLKTIVLCSERMKMSNCDDFFNTLLDKVAAYYLAENNDDKNKAKLDLAFYEQKFAFESRERKFNEISEREQEEHTRQKKLFEAIYRKHIDGNRGKISPLTKAWLDTLPKKKGLYRFGLFKTKVLLACHGYKMEFDGDRLSQKKPIRLVAKSFKHPFFK